MPQDPLCGISWQWRGARAALVGPVGDCRVATRCAREYDEQSAHPRRPHVAPQSAAVVLGASLLHLVAGAGCRGERRAPVGDASASVAMADSDGARTNEPATGGSVAVELVVARPVTGHSHVVTPSRLVVGEGFGCAAFATAASRTWQCWDAPRTPQRSRCEPGLFRGWGATPSTAKTARGDEAAGRRDDRFRLLVFGPTSARLGTRGSAVDRNAAGPVGQINQTFQYDQLDSIG